MEKFDAIVVGAGPAGCAAAFVMAKEGLKVLLLERGKNVGGKNVFGGRIYSHSLKKLFGNFEQEAPIERFVVKETIGLMDEDDCVSVDFSSHKGSPSNASSFIARRSRFDKWLSEKAEEAGAVVIPGTRVDDLLIKEGKVSGIVSSGDSIESDLVIDAEGVTATLSRRAGLRNDVTPSQIKVGVKETIQLSKEKIEDRFALDDNEGAASVFIGYPSSFLTASGAFIYTNTESVSIGVVVDPVELSRAKKEVHSMMEDFRLHPHMRRLLKGGKVIEYSAHMIPNSVPTSPSNLVGNGILSTGDAAGLFINHGFTYRGVDLAIASGAAAGRAAKDAHDTGRYDSEGLGKYHTYLAADLLPELQRAEETMAVLHNERIFSTYPRIAVSFMEEMFRIDGFGREKMSATLKRNLKGKVSTIRLLRDMLTAYRKS